MYILFRRNYMKRSILGLLGLLFLLSGCSNEADFLVTEVSEYQQASDHYMKIVFTPEDIPNGTELVAVKVGGISIKETYLLNDSNVNSPEEWEKNKISNLPANITEGEEHAVLLISEDPQIKEQDRLLFDYSTGDQVTSVESDFLQ